MFYIIFLMFIVWSTLPVTAKLQGLPVNHTTVETSNRDRLEIYKTFCNETDSERIYKNIQNFTKNIKPIRHQRLNIRGDKKVIEITENIWNVTIGDETTVSNVVDNGTTKEYSTTNKLDRITEITTKYTLLSTQYEISSNNLLNTTTTNSEQDLHSHSFVLASNDTSESTTLEMESYPVQEITSEAQLLTESEDNISSSLSPFHSTQQTEEPSSNKTIDFTIVEIDKSTTEEQVNNMSTLTFSNDRLTTYEKDIIVTEDYIHSSINNNEINFSKYESDVEITTLKAVVTMSTYENISDHSTNGGYLTTTYKENGVSTDETFVPDNVTMTEENVSNTVTLYKTTIPESSATKIEESSTELTTIENLIIFNTKETVPKMTTLEEIEIVTNNLTETEIRQTTEMDISELATEQTKSSEQSDLHAEDSTQYSLLNETYDFDLNTTFLPVTSASTEVIVSTVTEAIENTPQHFQETVLTTVPYQPITTIKQEIVLNPTETTETNNDSEYIRPIYHPFNNFTIEIPQKRQQPQSVHQSVQSFFLTFPKKRFYSFHNPNG